MKHLIQSTVLALLLSIVSSPAQPVTMNLTAGNVYYFRLAAVINLDNLALWQTPGFISTVRLTQADILFFPRALPNGDTGALTLTYHYDDGQYTGWLNEAFIQVFTTPNQFLIIKKIAGNMVWSLPPGIHYYGSDPAAATNWQSDFQASVALATGARLSQPQHPRRITALR